MTGTMRWIYQQGNLLLEAVATLPKKAKLVSKKFVIHDRTHNHTMRVPEFTDGHDRYVVVKSKAAATHPQHGDLVVPAGVYIVRAPRDHRRPTYAD